MPFLPERLMKVARKMHGMVIELQALLTQN